MSLSNWFGLRCKLMSCPCVQNDDATHVWGECIECGQRFGVISREALQRYGRAVESDRAFLDRMVREGRCTPAERDQALARMQ